MASRKKTGVAFWATVVVVVALAYVASFGPACWTSAHAQPSGDLVSCVYRPLLILGSLGPDWLQNAIWDYAALGITDERVIIRIVWGGWYWRGWQTSIDFK